MSRTKKILLTLGLLVAAPLEAFLTVLVNLVLGPLRNWIHETFHELLHEGEEETDELLNPDGSPMVTTLEEEINQWPSYK